MEEGLGRNSRTETDSECKNNPQPQPESQSSHDYVFLERGMSSDEGSLTRQPVWQVSMKVFFPAVVSLVLLHRAHCHPFPGGQRPPPADLAS